ncbi:MAG: methylated-DNA--[protein]-cysteine S-methyltransferase [Gammaproteobacteria bacterium]|nr:methylated-DNA--[protein]-cysteine S-methyltransferase [Gammaproteobacteria bacterium]
MTGMKKPVPQAVEINRRVWSTVQQIPEGKVATYGQVADLAGLGRAARRVGRALRELPAGSEVPWYRVIRAGGQIAFPTGSSAFNRQRKLLEAEGVSLINGRIDLGVYGWQRTLDELLWKPD